MDAFSELKVLDFSRYLPGGYCTQMLADMGARVIKVEDTNTGDMCRGDYPIRNGVSYYITALGRNKESVSLNLKDPDAVKWLHKMAEDAHILVESFRPGVTKKLGMDYETMKAINPKIIYCSITGYGEFDPRSKKASHDLNMQAATGYLDINGTQITPLPLVDVATHSVAGQAILAALLQRAATGQGSFVDISMFDCFVWWNSMLDSRWCFNGGQLLREDLDFPAVNYNIYETKDGGHLAFGMIELKFWKGWCEAVGRPDLIEWHMYRRWKAPWAFESVERIVKSKTLAEWVDWLADKDLCIEVVANKNEGIKKILDTEPNMMRYVDFPQAGRVIQTGIPHHVSSIPFDLSMVSEASGLGADTASCLEEAGATPQEVAEMADKGAICLGKPPLEDNVPLYKGMEESFTPYRARENTAPLPSPTTA